MCHIKLWLMNILLFWQIGREWGRKTATIYFVVYFINKMRKWAEKEEKTKMVKITNLISFMNIKKHRQNTDEMSRVIWNHLYSGFHSFEEKKTHRKKTSSFHLSPFCNKWSKYHYLSLPYSHCSLLYFALSFSEWSMFFRSFIFVYVSFSREKKKYFEINT